MSTGICKLAQNERVILARRPDGIPKADDFRFEKGVLPRPNSGQILVENIFLSLTPGDRLRMRRSIPIGDLIPSHTLSRVIDGHGSQQLNTGDLVLAKGGWQRFAVRDAQDLRRIDFLQDRPTVHLSILGAQGLTAYVGLLRIGQLQEGGTIVVSAASGTIGSIVGQIAKIQGCRTVGIFGGRDDKRRWLLEEIGFDAVIDESSVLDQLPVCCPAGIDIYFDNVGGKLLDGVLTVMARCPRKQGVVVCCGMISQYNRKNDEPAYGVRGLEALINGRIRMEGFVVGDWAKEYEAARDQLAEWYLAGRILLKEDVTCGLVNTPQAFIRAMSRQAFGKVLVKV